MEDILDWIRRAESGEESPEETNKRLDFMKADGRDLVPWVDNPEP